MAKVKFDVSGVDLEKALAERSSESPKPGVYPVKIIEINPGFSKDDSGKPDKSRPRLEVIYEVQAGEYRGARVWDYVSFSDASDWKLAQFLVAIGVAKPGKASSLKGEFDPEKIVKKGDTLKLRVISGKNLEGDYKAKAGGVFAWSDEDGEAEGEVEEIEEDDLSDLDEEELEEEEVEEEEEGEELTEEDIDTMSADELKELVKEHEIEIPKGTKVSAVRQLIKDHFWGEESEEEEDDSPF